MTQEHQGLGDFRGTARLFPLPNLVLFPHVAQPLHIFEPRYRQMMADALDDDRLLTMALLRPGWEESYQDRPPIHSMVCVGRVAHETGDFLADGDSRRVKADKRGVRSWNKAEVLPTACPQALTPCAS